MSAIPQRDLASVFRWQPWNHGDPPPEIWQIIQELDRVHQLRAATAILDAHIAVAQAQVQGLQNLRGVVAEAGKAGG